MRNPFHPQQPSRPSDRMTHELMDGIPNRPRRVVVVGDESDRVASVLRQRVPTAVIIAVHAIEALDHWGGWADLIISAWTDGIDPSTLAFRLRTAAPGGSTVVVLDRGAIELIDALQREFLPLDWAIETPPTGGQPVLRFVGQTAA